MKLASEIEQMLREKRIPYVLVEEAKKALFGGAKLTSFDFVIYMKDVPSWLLCCGERRREKVADMRQWQSIFGDGFRVAFAVRRAAGIRYMDMEGEPIQLVTGASLGTDLPPSEGQAIRRIQVPESRSTSECANLNGFVPSPVASQLSLFGMAI